MGGNLVVHQLIQQEDGTLNPQPVTEMVNQFKAKFPLDIMTKSSGIQVKNNSYSFSGSGYEAVIFSEMDELNKITGQIHVKDQGNLFGFTFNVMDGIGSLNVVFNMKTNQLEFYNVNQSQISEANPQIVVPLEIEKGAVLNYTLMVENTVAALYINDEIVLTTRMFNMPQSEWGLFSLESEVEFKDVELYK